MGFVLLTKGGAMEEYKNRPDYTTEMRLHDGTVEVITHCGRCMSVIWQDTCKHCDPQAVKAEQQARRELLGLDMEAEPCD